MEPMHLSVRKAVDILARGWTHGTARDDYGPCLVQGMLDALGNRKWGQLPWDLQLELDKHLLANGDYCSTPELVLSREQALAEQGNLQKIAVAWNDAPGRTQEEVVGMLTELADRLEAEHAAHLQELASQVRGISWEELERDLEDMWDRVSTKVINKARELIAA